jgi:hypothetical protein
MTTAEWVKLLVEVVTGLAWPTIALVGILFFRLEIKGGIARLISWEGPLGKVNLRAQEVQEAELEPAAVAPPLLSANTTVAPPTSLGSPTRGALGATGAQGPASAFLPSLAAGPSGPQLSYGSFSNDDPWRWCGTIYWLGNNMMFVALALAIGNLDAARVELDNAIHHATQLPLDPELVEELGNLVKQNFQDPSARKFTIERLIWIGSRFGIYIANQDPGFRETRDVPRSRKEAPR